MTTNFLAVILKLIFFIFEILYAVDSQIFNTDENNSINFI